MQEPQIARWLRYGVYAATLIPLVIFAQFVSPFHFGKVIVFRVLVEIMLVGYVLLVWRQPEYRPFTFVQGKPKSSLFTWAFLAFALVFTLTTITSAAPLQSWWGTLERMGGLFTFWHYFFFYLITISVLRTREHWQTLFDLMVSVGVVAAIYGFLQKTNWAFILGSGGRARPFGTIGNAALFAGYQILIAWLATTMLFLKQSGPGKSVATHKSNQGLKLIGAGLGAMLFLALAFNTEGLWIVPVGIIFYGIYLLCAHAGAARKFYTVAAVLTTVAVILTAVRGSLLAVAASAIIFSLLWGALNRSRRARNTLVGLLAAGILFVFLAIVLRSTSLVQNSGYLTRITDFSSKTRTVQTRLWTWKSGLEGWMETPKSIVLGWGPENFDVPFSHFFNPLHFRAPGSETFFDRAHNNFIEILATMGVLGLLVYLTMFGVLFRMFFRLIKRGGDERVWGIGFTAMIAAYLIHNTFIFDTSANFITFFMLAGFAVAVSQGFSSIPHPMVRRWTTGQYVGTSLLSLAALLLVWNTAVLPVRANYASTRATVAGWQGNFYQAVEKHREAIAYDTFGRYEFRQRFAQYLLDVSSAPNIGQISDFRSIMQEAISAMEESARENPPDYLPLLYIARLHVILGANDPASEDNDIAIEYVKRAIDISPTFVRAYYEIAQAYLNKEQPEQALAWFTKATELQPAVGISWWYMAVTRAQIAENTNDLAGTREALAYAEKAVENGYSLTETNAQFMSALYLKVGEPEKILDVLETAVRQNPSNPTLYARLGVAYANVGRYEDAVAALRKAKSLAPDDTEFQAQVDEVLKQLGETP